jgi:3-oxoacyl-(acyl-carrier-protein) synthase
LEVLGVGVGTAEQVAPLAALPAFRKATRNMALAFAAADAAVDTVVRERLQARAPEIGLVLGSCFGELDTTREFLDGVYENGLARPVLFQSSLHNATTGFIAIQMQLTGPSFTVSRGSSSGLGALELCASLCFSGLCKACLVLSVEARVAELEPLFQAAQLQGTADQLRRGNEGAAAVLLGGSGTAREMGLSPVAILEGVEALVPGSGGELAFDPEAGIDMPLNHCPVTELAQAIGSGEAQAGQLTDPAARGVSWRRT